MKKEHPLVCYDGMTGDLIKIQLRDGTQYSCTGVVDFLQPVLDEYLHDYPEIPILLRGDSGFSTPDLQKQCEENGTSYVIRLKENGILRGKASDLVDELDEITRNNKVDYTVVYGEFMYKAKSWPYERRVVCKVEKPENQMVYMYTFVVTNMRKQRIDTVRLKLLKIATKVINSARYITFKLCSSCPYKEEFYDTLSAIGKLNVQLEQQLSTNLDSVIIAQKLVIGILCPFSDKLREVMAAWIIFSIHGASFRLEIVP